MSFSISRTSIAFWWALCWRTMVWALILFIPLATIIALATLVIIPILIASAVVSPVAAILLTGGIFLLGAAFEYIIIPAILTGCAFNWLFRKGHFGKRTISGTYKGQPVTTRRQAIGFAFWFQLQTLKYLWPLYLVQLIADALVNTGHLSPNIMSTHAPGTGFFMIVVGIGYIFAYFLTITDILNIRTFKHFSLNVDKQNV